MNSDPDIVQRIDENGKALVSGYTERIEYTEMVRYHRGQCVQIDNCLCPEVGEKRVRHVKRPGYLKQLKEFAQNKDADLNPQPARGAPRVKKAKLLPELNGFLTLDEINCEVFMSLDRIFESAGRDRTWLSKKIEYILISLRNPCMDMLTTGHDDQVHEIARLMDRWVGMARRTLNLTVQETAFDGVVCGNCGGGLASPNRIEGANVAVRCIGTPTTPPCGTEYPASEWLSLLEGKG